MFQVEKEIKCFEGTVYKLSHESKTVNTTMKLNVFIPPNSNPQTPCVFYLAGLTCTGDNGLEKGGFLEHCAKENLIIVFPDTSPRTPSTAALPNEHDSYDFGSGAGFYLNATTEGYDKYYQMESYITEELLSTLKSHFTQFEFQKLGIMGHSMGGHGALTLFLKHPGLYKSVSAFAPICNPCNCPWGQKAFKGYLGDVEKGKSHDATELVKTLKSGGANNAEGLPRADVLIDVGTGDQFYKDQQLLPENLLKVSENTPFKVNLQIHEGYDHSYFFISTFAGNHIKHHANVLRM